MTYFIIDLQNFDCMQCIFLETALGKLACEVKANDARLGVKALNQVLQAFNN